jgi:hypothetical protein
MASSAGIEPADLPIFGPSSEDGHPNVEFDGLQFHYVSKERNVEYKHMVLPSSEDAMYQIFEDAAFRAGVRYSRARSVPGRSDRRLIYERQAELLGLLRPEWKSRIEVVQAEKLKSQPFDDCEKERADFARDLRGKGKTAGEAWTLACKQFPLPLASGQVHLADRLKATDDLRSEVDDGDKEDGGALGAPES